MDTETNNIAVIDTETNYYDEVMSIGIVIADSTTFSIEDRMYGIITPECRRPSMFGYVLTHKRADLTLMDSRNVVMEEVIAFLDKHDVKSIYAYNGGFDKSHLPELSGYFWADIMKIAAYRQYNPKITDDCACCKTGRLRSGYGVEDIFRMLSGNRTYFEVHNALADAEDELKIMKMLGHDISVYLKATI